MKKPGWLTLTVAVMALVAGAMLCGQGAGGGRGGDRAGAGAFDRERAQLTLALLELSKPEVAAALKSAEVKEELSARLTRDGYKTKISTGELRD